MFEIYADVTPFLSQVKASSARIGEILAANQVMMESAASRNVGIVAAAYFGQFTGNKIKVESMGNRASTLTAIRMIEYMLILDRAFQYRRRNLESGFFA